MTEPTDPATLAELLSKLSDAATPGPWHTERPYALDPEIESESIPGDIWPSRRELTGCAAIAGTEFERDQLLIVALRNALPAICQHLRSLAELREQREGELAEVRKALGLMAGGVGRSLAEEAKHQILMAALDEREACARVCDEKAAGLESAGCREESFGALDCADAIRSRRSTASPAPGKEGGR